MFSLQCFLRLCLFAWVMLPGLVSADTLSLFAAAGVKAPAETLVAAFEQHTGHRVLRVYDTAGAAEQRFVLAGKQGVLITTEQRLRQSAALEGGTLRPLADTVAGIAVAPSASRPAIDTAAALKQALLSARRIAFSDPSRGATVGLHFLRVIDQLGIRDEVLAKAVKARDGIETMALVRTGAVDLGITQVSEIVQADAQALLGPFPPEFDLYTRYSLWLAPGATPAAQALAEALTNAEAQAQWRQQGLRVP